MNFCSHCGHSVTLRIPEGDNLPRYVCDACNAVHYQNPKMVVGAIPVWEDKVLLCRRAIEPRYGLWTLPAGFMENGETTGEGAAREAKEEANANIEILSLYSMFDLPHINQVYIMYRARLLDLHYRAGDESLEVALFAESDIPWERLAFRTIHETLRHFFGDRHRGHYGLHTGTITPTSRAS
ncbi:MAG TPA: NUDIX hydrolase [Gammaproteobacteria bacterium]|nr:NUDIX hydrolase [Gammaproteobacteria bacterium]